MSLLTLAGCISFSDISLSVGYGLFYGGRLAMPQTCKPIRPTLFMFNARLGLGAIICFQDEEHLLLPFGLLGGFC
jgi:hypothetical protein